MRVLTLSSGSIQEQLQRLPALWTIASELKASIQVACDPSQKAIWDLLPAVEKVIPFEFNSNPSLADWANLLGTIREQDFQICLNFATGTQVNLMLSMSHIPIRVAERGFSRTKDVDFTDNWSSQRLESYLRPIGLSLDADSYRILLPKEKIEEASDKEDKRKLILLVAKSTSDCSYKGWQALQNQLTGFSKKNRHKLITKPRNFSDLAIVVASSDIIISNCPVTQILAIYCGIKLIALDATNKLLPKREGVSIIEDSGVGITEMKQQKILDSLSLIS